MITRVKGTQDWLDLELFNFVVNQAQRHVKLYNFQEIATPLLESTELFIRSLGEHTDVISKEMFMISPRNEGDSICLRPEATASIARAFIENTIQSTPWKVFTWGPMFRYERPQKGRLRQFHQINMEVIGSQSITQDAQFITMLDRFFHETLRMRNYALVVNFLGCAQDRIAYKNHIRAFLDNAGDLALCELCKVRKEKNILRIFDCKTESCQQLYQQAPRTAECVCEPCAREWQTLQEELEQLSVSFSYRPTLVRGLDYYNKTVFEFVSNDLGAQSAFCGGGRYDHLLRLLGGKVDQPSLGAAIGIERLLLALEGAKNHLPLAHPPALHVIIPFAREQQSLALILADMLRSHNLVTDVLLEGDHLKHMMRQAHKMGATYCLLLGEKEQQEGSVTVKNMITGHEEMVAQINLAQYLKR